MFGQRSGRTGDVGDPDVTELNRRVANIIRVGTIAEADYAKARARVQIGPLLTTWRPWLAERASLDITWRAPEIGEQVLLFSPGGDLTQGIILAGLYQQAFPAPADRETVHRTIYQDQTLQEYDREAHGYLLDVNPAGSITLQVGPSSIVMDANGIRLTAPRIDLNEA